MPRTNGSNKKPRFMLHVIGRYESTGTQAEPQVTANLLTGTDDRFVYSGTFTMAEREWEDLVSVLQRGLRSRFQLASGPISTRPPRKTGKPTGRRRRVA
jgi:hypothetical protein